MSDTNNNDKSNFKSKNGATLAGHSSKWSNQNRRSTSHDSGQGSRGSRNQGTGMQGKLNTMPSQGIDTSRMKPEEKLKYFKSLGLMPGAEPTPEPEVQPEPKPERNKVQALTQDLQKIFKDHPNYLSSIVSALKAVEPAQFKKAVFAAYRAMQEITSQNDVDQKQVLQYILNAIDETSISEDYSISEAPTMLNTLEHIWSRIFSDNPEYVNGLTSIVKRIHPEKYRDALDNIYQTTVQSEKESSNPQAILQNIFDIIRKFK